MTMRNLAIIAFLAFFSCKPVGAEMFPAADMAKKLIKQPAVHPTASQKSESEPVRINRILKKLKGELVVLDSPGGLGVGAPQGTPEYKLITRRFMLRLLIRNYDRQLSEIQKIEALRKEMTDLNKRIAGGITLKGNPPYSVLMVEEIREQVQVAQFRLKEVEASLELNRTRMIGAEDGLKKSEEMQRTVQEKLETVSSPAAVDGLEWEKKLAELLLNVNATGIAALKAEEKSLNEELLVARKAFSFYENNLRAAIKEMKFSDDDLKVIKERLESGKQKYENLMETALAEHQSLTRQLEALGQKFSVKVESLAESIAEEESELIRGGKFERGGQLHEELENNNLKMEVYQDLIELNRLELMIWELRYSSESKGDQGSVRDLMKLLPRTIVEIEQRIKSTIASLNLVLKQINERESQLLQPDMAGSREMIKTFLAFYNERQKLLLLKIRELEGVRSILVRLLDQYTDSTRKAATDVRIKYWKVLITEKVLDFWRYELFTTDDTIMVDGRELKGQRGVTVGKVVIAVIILVLGYIVSSAITRKFVSFSIRKYNVQESSALLVRRWFLALIAMVLILSSLNIVRIPLTAFAFLGGAVALGAGFGMQVLMKNLMSGVMLLVERPVRIGDLVDVDGIRGRVISIGIRSSTIKDAAGIETLIPNSTFVEKNVTNWTYSNHQVRYTVNVGVSYGSNISEVKKRLLEVADRHGQLLKNPEPMVALDDFASDALLFGLYYWIDLEDVYDPKIIASDLRMMIEKNLTEAGIIIAFPQRDIHLDSLKPLQVEIKS